MKGIDFFNDSKRLLRLSLLAFGIWLFPIAALMLLEWGHMGEGLFASGVLTYGYLIVHGLLTAFALGLGMLTLVRGPAKNRVIIVVPVALLFIYAGVLIGGPG